MAGNWTRWPETGQLTSFAKIGIISLLLEVGSRSPYILKVSKWTVSRRKMRKFPCINKKLGRLQTKVAGNCWATWLIYCTWICSYFYWTLVAENEKLNLKKLSSKKVENCSTGNIYNWSNVVSRSHSLWQRGELGSRLPLILKRSIVWQSICRTVILILTLNIFDNMKFV